MKLASPTVGDFLRAWGHDLLATMSGVASVPFAILAAAIPDMPARVSLGALAALSFLFASYRVWRQERSRTLVFEKSLNDSHALKEHTAAILEQAAAIREQTSELKRRNDFLFPERAALITAPLTPPAPHTDESAEGQKDNGNSRNYDVLYSIGSRPKGARNRLSIREAARIAYEATQSLTVGELVDENYQTADDRLEYFIYGMLLHESPPFSLMGLSPPSEQTPREIPAEDRRRLVPIKGSSDLRWLDIRGIAGMAYINVTVTRDDLDLYIAYLKRISNMKP